MRIRTFWFKAGEVGDNNVSIGGAGSSSESKSDEEIRRQNKAALELFLRMEITEEEFVELFTDFEDVTKCLIEEGYATAVNKYSGYREVFADKIATDRQMKTAAVTRQRGNTPVQGCIKSVADGVTKRCIHCGGPLLSTGHCANINCNIRRGEKVEVPSRDVLHMAGKLPGVGMSRSALIADARIQNECAKLNVKSPNGVVLASNVPILGLPKEKGDIEVKLDPQKVVMESFLRQDANAQRMHSDLLRSRYEEMVMKFGEENVSIVHDEITVKIPKDRSNPESIDMTLEELLNTETKNKSEEK